MLGAFPFDACGDIVIVSGRRAALKSSVLGMVMEGYGPAFGRLLTMPTRTSRQAHRTPHRDILRRAAAESFGLLGPQHGL